jgi:uncharacterized protein
MADDHASSNAPYILLFRADHHFFCLDKHTNRTFLLSETEAHILERWLRGARLEDLASQYPIEVGEIRQLMNEGVFCSLLPHGLQYSSHWDEICQRILHERSQTILEITQSCNLRCKYCTFGGDFPGHRTHSSLSMSVDTAKRSVDSALEHSDAREKITIGFYGGEPLLAFDTLQAAVLYAKSKTSHEIHFSITTNATLIDRRIARFLKEHKFSVLVSVDGPKRLHNLFRVFPSGMGSYDAAMNGLRVLQDSYPAELHHKIGLNMVIPATEWILYLGELWDNEPWLSRGIRAQATPADMPAGLQVPVFEPKPERNAARQLWLASLKETGGPETELLREYFERSLIAFHQRRTFKGHRETFPPNGCCVPGARKVFIDAGGNYQICERAQGLPFIGNLENGIDLKSIKHIIGDYARKSWSDCKRCSAISNCSLCFIHAYHCGAFSLDRKRQICDYFRQKSLMDLQYYAIISLGHPELLAHWDQVKLA